MPLERRISRALSLLAAAAVPCLLLAISLPSRVNTDRSALYAVAISLAVLALLHHAVRVRFPREGETLTGMPQFLGSAVALSILSVLAVAFGGGVESPFFPMAFFCCLLAGVSLDHRCALSLWLILSTALAVTISAHRGGDWAVTAVRSGWFLAGVLLGMDMRREILEIEGTRETLSLELERHLERGREKSERISAVSHELRTPLTSMQGFAEILSSRKPPGKKVDEFARIIGENSERMLRLASGLLDLCRVESEIAPRKEPLELDRLAAEVCEASSMLRDEVSVRLERSGEVPIILADPTMVQLALGNLISNAIKFSPPGEVVTVRVGSTERYAYVSVTDRGPGIPREELAFIFHSFRRGTGSREVDPRGAGLGLAVVKGVADSHGGTVRVVTSPGKGSTFTLLLPISEEPARTPQRPEGRVKVGRNNHPIKGHVGHLPLFLLFYLGVLALFGHAGPLRPGKALSYLLVLLLSLLVTRPDRNAGHLLHALRSAALFLLLAYWVAALERGALLSFPPILTSATHLARSGQMGLNIFILTCSLLAYLVPSAVSPARDAMVLATHAFSLVLISFFVMAVERETRLLEEQLDQLRESLRVARERDREASRLLETAGKGMIGPLQTIRDLSLELHSTFSETRVREVGIQILQRASELGELTEALLDLMRVEAGKTSLALCELSPEDVADLLRTAAVGEVETEVEEDGEGGSVVVDPERLAQAIRLATLSWPASPPARILLVWRKGEEGTQITVLSSEKGEGATGTMENARENEAREDLGLTLARRFVGLMGGSLESLGMGKVLRIRFPRLNPTGKDDGPFP